MFELTKREWLRANPPRGGVDPVTTPTAPTAPAATTPSPAPAGQPAGTPAGADKFANASKDDVLKAYTELETKLGAQGQRLGALAEYEKLGKPQELGQAIDWARETYQKINRGEYVSKADAAKAQAIANAPQSAGNGPQEPWKAEGWEFLPPAQQSAAMAAYTQAQSQAYLDTKVAEYVQQFGNQIQQMRGTQSREQSLIMKALELAQSNPGKVDLRQLLQSAADMATKPPEEYMELALQSMVNPQNNEAEIERRVTARMAEEAQKKQNEDIGNINRAASSTPRFATKLFKDRNEENGAIMRQWQKDGINPF